MGMLLTFYFGAQKLFFKEREKKKKKKKTAADKAAVKKAKAPLQSENLMKRKMDMLKSSNQS